MKINSVIQKAREHKVEQVIAATSCTRDEAISYLFAEEWFVADAVLSYRVDSDIRSHRDQRIENRPL